MRGAALLKVRFEPRPFVGTDFPLACNTFSSARSEPCQASRRPTCHEYVPGLSHTRIQLV